jgi:hypothetical protein
MTHADHGMTKSRCRFWVRIDVRTSAGDVAYGLVSAPQADVTYFAFVPEADIESGSYT